ncbi:kinase-like domain-containing protein [Ephemerocybe angulata]|uniref:Kinase-like domain-containing protein n=1 Tax=Ephemerocybe angulata TaxID=980116 RepID=A0A8H6HZT4_9AGAR|nr:kinase-like domain-containing protein [Tulosesus angulatus]
MSAFTFTETETTESILQAITTVIPNVTNIPDLELELLPVKDFTLIPEVVGISPITNRQHYSAYATGSYADVFRALSKAEGTNGEVVVFKVFRDAHLGSEEKDREEAKRVFVKRLRRECAVWGMLRHRNISRLWGVVIHPELSSAGLVSSFRPHGALGDFIEKRTPYDCITMAQGIACALEYIHAITPDPVVHGDLTPANILVDYDETKKEFFPLLTDFGKSRVMDKHGYTTTVSTMTPLYRAPEVFTDLEDATEATNHRLVPRSDVYSLGMLLYKLITGHDPFYKEHFLFPIAMGIAIAEEGLRMTKDKYPVPSQYEWCWPIMDRCWEYKADERLTSKEAHRYLRKGPGADGTTTPVSISFVAADAATAPSP